MRTNRRLATAVASISVAGLIVYVCLRSGPIFRAPRPKPARFSSHPREETHPGDETPTDVTPSVTGKVSREDGIYGVVIDAEGYGVPGAKVEAGVFEGKSPGSLAGKVFVQTTITGSNGGFRFPDRSAFGCAEELLGSAALAKEESSKRLHSLLIASKENYVAARCLIDFESVTGPQTVVLKEAPEISGRVIWKENGEGASGARIACHPDTRDLYYSPANDGVDGEGRFRLVVYAEGGAALYAHLEYVMSASPLTLVAGEKIHDLVFALELGSNTIIEGRVLDAQSGGPVAGAEVRPSTERRVGFPSRSQADGSYRVGVPYDWPYQSYFLEDWKEKPEFWLLDSSGRLLVTPKHESPDSLTEGERHQWTPLWLPPPNAPPERLVAWHPDYEMGTVEVPLLGVGQVRTGVDILLEKGSRVSGKVVDDMSEPAPEARIRIRSDPVEGGVLIKKDNRFLYSKEVAVAEDGSFEISFLPTGSYELTASATDCDLVTKQLELGPHQVVGGFDFVLVKRRGFIRGKVLDQDGDPWVHGRVRADIGDHLGSGTRHVYMPDARVVLDRPREVAAEINEDGSYELAPMEPGEYNIWVDASADYEETEGSLYATSLRNVATGTENANITVMERPAGALRVRVIDQSGQPIQKFHVVCCPLSMAYGRSGIFTGKVKEIKGARGSRSYSRDRKHSAVLHLSREVASDGGEFTSQRVAPGVYFVYATAEGHSERFKEVKVEAGGETVATLELGGLSRVEGIVRDGRGQPLEGVPVGAMKMKDVLNRIDRVRIGRTFTEWNRLYSTAKTKSGQDGRFALENLEQTDYRITAQGPTGRSVFADVSVAQNGENFVELVLIGGSASVVGYVYGEDGRAISEAEVTLEGDGQEARTPTDKEGSYVFENLPPGRYLVRARLGDTSSRHYRGREVELAEGERAFVDIVAWGDGEIRGRIHLAGEASRAAAWFGLPDDHVTFLDYDRRLVLREVTNSGIGGANDLWLPVDEIFELKGIPAGTYEARAHLVVRVSPEPDPLLGWSCYFSYRSCHVKFVSPPQVVRVVAGSSASIDITVSEARAPHYPIPDPVTCDRRVLGSG